MARLVVADDHPLYVQALTASLVEEGLEVAGVAERGDEVLVVVAETQPDAVLLDLAMPGIDGYACLEQLRQQHPDVPVMVVSGAEVQVAVTKALDLGAAGFVGKAVSAPELAHAVRIMLGKQPVYTALPSTTGEPAVHTALPSTASEPPPLHARAAGAVAAASPALTRRELEILQLVADGLSNGHIARKLWVTEQTVKFHVTNILKKLGAANRTEAAYRALQLDLVHNRESSPAHEAPAATT